METIKLELGDYNVAVEINNSGIKEKKHIDYDELSKVFSSQNVYESGILPGEYGMKYIYEGDNDKSLYVYTEPAHEIKYTNANFSEYVDEDDYIDEDGDFDEDGYYEAIEELKAEIADKGYKSLTPSLMWVVLKESYNFTVYVFALKDPVFFGTEKLYFAPFGNIYANEQKVCWGNDTSLSIPSIQALQTLSFTFFKDFENYDLSTNRIKDFKRKSGYDGNRPEHLHMEVNRMYKEENVTDEEALEYIHKAMKPIKTSSIYNAEGVRQTSSDENDALQFNEVIDYFKGLLRKGTF